MTDAETDALAAAAIVAREAIDDARDLAFQSLVEDAAGDGDKANRWFARLVVEAFAQHFYRGELGDEEGPDRTAAMANVELEGCGAAWRLVRVPDAG